MTRPPWLGCRAADVALIGVAINLVVLIAAPLLRPDLDLWRQSLSYYAVGPLGVVQAVAFIAFAVATVALGVALLVQRTQGGQSGAQGPASAWLWICGVMLVISGIGSIGLVWYPMGSPGPATPLGDAHQTAGTISGVALLAATLAFSLAARANPVWQGLFATSLTLFLIASIGALLSQIAIWWPELGIPMGATMRLLAIPLVALWGLVAWRLRRACRR